MSQRVEVLVFNALKPLVSNRVYPNQFPQDPATPKWPAIRMQRIVTTPVVTVCGDGGDESADVLMQLDIVALNWNDVVILRGQVMAAMDAIPDPKPVWSGEGSDFDVETKTHRVRLDYTFYPSSGDGTSYPD